MATWGRHLKAFLVGAALGAGALMLATPPDAPLLHCWDCGKVRATIPIVYGLPGEKLIAAADRGEVMLGGCMVEMNAPVRACATCRRPLGFWDRWSALVVLVP